MAESIVVTTPENQNNADVRIDASIDSTNNLSLSYNGRPLASANGNLEIECDPAQIVRITVHNFVQGTQTWTVAAVPKSRPSGSAAAWDEGQGFVFDENSGHLTDFVSVNVTVTGGTTSRPQRIFVKTKPRKSGPDPQMQQG